MGQDLRKLFETERKSKTYPMREGHEARFLERLESELPKKEPRPVFYWVRIAAGLALLISIGAYFLIKGPLATKTPNTIVVDKANPETSKTGISLGDLSPDLQKVENFYMASINYELSQLDVCEENKEMVDGFMEQLGGLDEEYRELNKELNEFGPNDETISALIQNLQLRLQLLQKLKQKLNQLKSSENEQEINII